MFNFAKKIIIENRENDDLLYEFVLTELENETIVKSLWAKAIAMAEGNTNKIKPLYMQYRVQNIKDQFTKLNIAYQDIKKEILFQKIKSIFIDSEVDKEVEQKVITKKEPTEMDLFFNPELKQENDKSLVDTSYEEKRIKEIDKALNKVLNQYKNGT